MFSCPVEAGCSLVTLDNWELAIRRRYSGACWSKLMNMDTAYMITRYFGFKLTECAVKLEFLVIENYK